MDHPSELDPEHTGELLLAWHGGDARALELLIERDLPWVRGQVERRLGPLLRQKGDPGDFVQEAMVEFLRYGPRFVIEDRDRFRGLLARIIENVLRDQHDWFTAQRRAVHRERPLPQDSVLHLDGAARSVTRPSEHAARSERENYLRLALELLPPDDRRVILLRQWEELSFEEVGERIGCTTDAARMRFHRALPKLAAKVEELQNP